MTPKTGRRSSARNLLLRYIGQKVDKVQVTSASEPGSPDKPNEDGLVVTADMLAVLDGATVRTDTGCIHGVAWFVGSLAGSLARNKELAPAETLAEAITETAAAHGETCDLKHPATPS